MSSLTDRYVHAVTVHLPEQQRADIARELFGPEGVDDIRRSIAADSLAYVSLEGLEAASHQPHDQLCRACFDGVYPVEVDEGADDLGVVVREGGGDDGDDDEGDDGGTDGGDD